MIKTVWVCDGCDESRTMNGPSDWKAIEISVSGFSGYPVSDGSNLDEARFELCPSCQRTLADRINPKLWPRVEKVAA